MFTPNDLKFRGSYSIGSKEYAALDDGAYIHIYDLSYIDFKREYADYNDFCQQVRAISDESAISRHCREMGIRGAYTAGSCVYVSAAADDDDQ